MKHPLFLAIAIVVGTLLGAAATAWFILNNEEKKSRAAIAKRMADQEVVQSSFSRQQDSLWSVIHYNDSLLVLKRTYADSQQFYFYKALSYERKVNQAQIDYLYTGQKKYEALFYKYDRLKVKYAKIAYRWGEKALAILAMVK